MSAPEHYRILVVDDNPAIHDDFLKILLGHQGRSSSLDAAEAILFDKTPAASGQSLASFTIDSAYQGREALDKLTAELVQLARTAKLTVEPPTR